VRHRPELAPPVRAAFARLHTEAERAVTEQLVARGWQVTAAHGSSFWAAVFGIVLERAATGDAFDPASAETSLQLILNLYTDPDARR
jgi:Bacterial transcriptional repressor C-terminal